MMWLFKYLPAMVCVSTSVLGAAFSVQRVKRAWISLHTALASSSFLQKSEKSALSRMMSLSQRRSSPELHSRVAGSSSVARSAFPSTGSASCSFSLFLARLAEVPRPRPRPRPRPAAVPAASRSRAIPSCFSASCPRLVGLAPAACLRVLLAPAPRLVSSGSTSWSSASSSSPSANASKSPSAEADAAPFFSSGVVVLSRRLRFGWSAPGE
mmetsp:Transcript_47854/g.119819  ORF Transcript_47854/g.119819 Transcript_47854/m.119819 type:complete len:211 (+) Transcript_47854:1153-1785(+)